MDTFDDIERRRELNEGVHPSPGDGYDEEGTFAVRTVFLDGVERIESTWTSLRDALLHADHVRVELLAKNYDRHRVLVDVVDMDDPERGSLDWDVLA